MSCIYRDVILKDGRILKHIKRTKREQEVVSPPSPALDLVINSRHS
jgi:hypothetical protein